MALMVCGVGYGSDMTLMMCGGRHGSDMSDMALMVYRGRYGSDMVLMMLRKVYGMTYFFDCVVRWWKVFLVGRNQGGQVIMRYFMRVRRGRKGMIL